MSYATVSFTAGNSARAGVIQERLGITDQKLTELQVERFEEGGDAEQVRSNFGNLRHSASTQDEAAWYLVG